MTPAQKNAFDTIASLSTGTRGGNFGLRIEGGGDPSRSADGLGIKRRTVEALVRKGWVILGAGPRGSGLYARPAPGVA